jgi:hypothetical protein
MRTSGNARAVSLKALLRCVVVACALVCVTGLFAQSTGDFRTRQSGNWTAFTTWERYNGSNWVNAIAGQTPTTNVSTPVPNVTIRATHTVFEDGAGPYSVNNLTVEAGGRLWAGPGMNRYINIYGTTLQCDGEIGSGPSTFDQISFNIDGANVIIQGSGIFNASRLRKNFNANTTTNLTIAMDMNLLFNTASSAQIYNNFDGTVNFNVTINAGVTVNITGNGNISMDGVDGLSIHARGGSYTVNGTLNVSGIIYMTTNNTNVAQQVRFTINNGGVVRATRVNVSNSGAAGHVLTINAGGTLELTGTGASWASFNVPSTNNTFTLDAASTLIYSAAGVQNVIPVPGGYGNLHVRGTGDKQLSAATVVKGNVLILNTDGSPVLDVMPNNWQLNVRGNWTSYGDGGFNERNGLVLFEQGNAQAVSTSGGERFYTWRIDKSGSLYVVMNSGVTLTNNLNLPANNGRLDLNGNQLTLLNGAANAITGAFAAQRHILSERTDNASRVRWDIGTNLGVHNIPFGTSAGTRVFTFNLTAGNAGQVTVSTYGTGANNLPWPTTPVAVTNLDGPLGLAPDNRDATVDRFWQVDVSGTPTATLTFRYNGAELPAAPFNTALAMHAQRYDATANAWQEPIEGQTLSSFAAVVPGVTEFGPWTISALASPLPIELLSFQAEPEGDKVLLDWATASERDNAYFTIQRSADGVHFVDLLRTAAVGDSWSRNDYSAVDDAPLTGTSYYRLRQTDLDGTYSESAVVPVYRRESRSSGIIAYPNPTDGPLTLVGIGAVPFNIRIIDAAGRVVLVQSIDGDGDRYNVDVRSLAPGRYLALVQHEAGVDAVPFMRE